MNSRDIILIGDAQCSDKFVRALTTNNFGWDPCSKILSLNNWMIYLFCITDLNDAFPLPRFIAQAAAVFIYLNATSKEINSYETIRNKNCIAIKLDYETILPVDRKILGEIDLILKSDPKHKEYREYDDKIKSIILANNNDTQSMLNEVPKDVIRGILKKYALASHGFFTSLPAAGHKNTSEIEFIRQHP